MGRKSFGIVEGRILVRFEDQRRLTKFISQLHPTVRFVMVIISFITGVVRRRSVNPFRTFIKLETKLLRKRLGALAGFREKSCCKFVG